MKLRSIKPTYQKGEVLTEGVVFETLEQHGRELIQRGYAEEVKAREAEPGSDRDPKGKGKAK